MRNARLDDLKFQWNKTKFYIKDKIYEIPDIIGYWSGKELVLDKLEPGEYRLKYFGDSLNEKYCVIFTVENNITAIPLSVPEWATAIYVYKSNGLYVGKVRITQINSTGTEGVSKEFVENYAQPKGDYLTQADKETIIQEVIDILGTPVFGTVDEENNIILSGNLVDGTYTLKYEKEEGNTMEIGKLTISGDTPTYTNVVLTSESMDSTAIYNGCGYKDGYYISSTGGVDSAKDGHVTTGMIAYDCDNPATIYVKGGSVDRIAGYNTDKSYITMVHGAFETTEISANYYKLEPTKVDSDEYTLTHTYGRANWLRFDVIGTGSDLIITLNEEITDDENESGMLKDPEHLSQQHQMML